MLPEQRIQEIEQRLQKAFSTSKLEVIDDSHKHIGHAGASSGAGHYTVVIAAECFQGKPRVAIHREIYAVLADLIPHEIHALQIKLA
jgi:BolA protein